MSPTHNELTPEALHTRMLQRMAVKACQLDLTPVKGWRGVFNVRWLGRLIATYHLPWANSGFERPNQVVILVVEDQEPGDDSEPNTEEYRLENLAQLEHALSTFAGQGLITSDALVDCILAADEVW